MRITHAARLLADARTLDALRPLAQAAGFASPPLAVPRATRRQLGVDDDVCTRARLAIGPGPLRALLAEVPPALPLRDAARTLAARLATRAAHGRWLLLLVHADGRALAVAAWTPARAGAPRLHALVCAPHDVRDSDAETLRALHAHAAPAGASDADALLAHQRWIDVLGRERLGTRFYHALAHTVATLADTATGVDDPAARAELALLCTTRCLFLAFLQAKGWLDGDHAFLAHRYDACLASGGDAHRRLLRPLFYGTLNTPRRHRAPAARAFGLVPFLNGGLFARTPLERRHRAHHLDDAALGALVHDLLGRHRFTAREDAATWSEAAVDPAMLGRAFESLMHARERRATGAFYTPAPLVARATDQALRAALVDGGDGRPPLDAALVDDALSGVAPARRAHVHALHARLAALRVLDPACGSGAFLVHALERVAALLATAGDARPVSDRRRAVLTASVFGVDRNPTAVWLCELRLWLSCVIECDDDPRHLAPLPNLDHNVRVGDALATPAGLPPATDSWGGAPWGGVTMTARAASTLADRRARYARRSGAPKRAAARTLDAAERARALDAVDRALATLRHERRETLARLRARDLFGARPPATAAARARLDTLRATIRAAARTRATLAAGGALPFGFAWHFADVGAAAGFDCIVGNPPWVRPHALPATARAALRAQYATVRDAPWRAGAALAGAGLGFAGQADLAAPFVERSLALLRPGGALALLVPAKLWRALAGGGLRALLARESRLLAVEDWSEAPALFDAATYPALLVAARRPRTAHDAPTPAPAVHVRVHRARGDVAERIAPRDLALDADDLSSPWLLLPRDARAAFDALRAAGPALADAALARPTLGVKCGCNDAFLVEAEPGDGPTALVHAGERSGRVERALLRPILRGEDLAPGTTPASTRGTPSILWTHGADGAPLAALPPLAARWLAPWRTRLAARTDARGARWWSLFRTAAADASRPRVCWADLARSPAPRVLDAGDPTVPLNSCYVVSLDDARDARALAALLATPLASAWLGALAEPARGGFRRHLAWTVALLPTPRDWTHARPRLAAALDAPPAARNAVLAAAFGLPLHRLAPLLAWDAGIAPAAADDSAATRVRLVRERRADAGAPTAIPAPIAPTRWRGPHARGSGGPC